MPQANIKMKQNKSQIQSEKSFHIQIPNLNTESMPSPSPGPTIFTLRTGSIKTPTDNITNSPSISKSPIRAPEKKLTLFALRLAVIEKAASGIGTLGFIWATVVLLGGFAITLEPMDFWLVTIILLIEGTRIFSRSHELEWQHQSTWTITDVGLNSFHAIKTGSSSVMKIVKRLCYCVHVVPTRTSSNDSSHLTRTRTQPSRTTLRMPTRVWASNEVPIIPYAKWVFISRNVSKILYWLQLASATACAILSLMKLVDRNYGPIEKGDGEKRNRKAALVIFYSLAFAEASLFLLEKAYWEWKVNVKKILEEVNKECGFNDESGLISTRRFFYDAYSRCIYGSIFDGLKMDMVSFAMELLGSNSPDEQLIGARILRQFSTTSQFCDDTLQKIGTNILVMERLVEILNWNDPCEEEIRYSAAEIITELVGKKQTSLRIAGVPGAMESISSLLQISRGHNGTCDEVSEKKLIFDNENYGSWSINHLGLQILKKLARDRDICGKIGNTRGLLPKVVDFMHAEEGLLRHPSPTTSQIVTVKRALQVLKMLASASGDAGKKLRKEISEIVLTISYIRDILKHGEKQHELQMLGIEILTNLAINEDATERIVATGGVVKELLSIFFNGEIQQDNGRVRTAAGEALAMLTLRNKNTCCMILKLRINHKLIKSLEVHLLRMHSARILRNLSVYSGDDCFEQLKELTCAGPIILEAIMKEKNKQQEVMIGAAANIFKFMISKESRIMFIEAGIREYDLVHRLVMLLKNYQYPSIKVPSIRRYAIDLTIWMMKDDPANIQSFQSLGMAKELVSVMETTSELENFHIFCGTVGLCRHGVTMQSLVKTALNLLEEEV